MQAAQFKASVWKGQVGKKEFLTDMMYGDAFNHVAELALSCVQVTWVQSLGRAEVQAGPCWLNLKDAQGPCRLLIVRDLNGVEGGSNVGRALLRLLALRHQRNQRAGLRPSEVAKRGFRLA